MRIAALYDGTPRSEDEVFTRVTPEDRLNVLEPPTEAAMLEVFARAEVK